MTLEEYDQLNEHNKKIKEWAKVTRPVFGNITEVVHNFSHREIIGFEIARMLPRLNKLFEYDSSFYRHFSNK